MRWCAVTSGRWCCAIRSPCLHPPSQTNTATDTSTLSCVLWGRCRPSSRAEQLSRSAKRIPINNGSLAHETQFSCYKRHSTHLWRQKGALARARMWFAGVQHRCRTHPLRSLALLQPLRGLRQHESVWEASHVCFVQATARSASHWPWRDIASGEQQPGAGAMAAAAAAAQHANVA